MFPLSNTLVIDLFETALRELLPWLEWGHGGAWGHAVYYFEGVDPSNDLLTVRMYLPVLQMARFKSDAVISSLFVKYCQDNAGLFDTVAWKIEPIDWSKAALRDICVLGLSDGYAK